jgi:hypothetical protein
VPSCASAATYNAASGWSSFTNTVSATGYCNSTNANLSSLSVSGYSLSPTFNASTTSYTLAVPYSVTSITISAAAADSKAKSVVGTGAKSGLQPGSGNVYDVVVTAEDNNTKTYKITVTRQSNDANLSGLSVSGYDIAPAFSASTTYYTLTAADSKAKSVSGTGAQSLSIGSNTCNVVVTAEDNSTKTYTIMVTRQSNDANLSSLSVSGYDIAPAFSADTTAYTLTVPYSVASLTINAAAADSKARSVSGTGTRGLSVGSNTCNVMVTAEDNSIKIYTITVTREMASADATLASLSVAGYGLGQAFNPNDTTYSLAVPYSAQYITLEATPASSVARGVSCTMQEKPYTIGEAVYILVGETLFRITVTAENGATKKYMLVVTRVSQDAPQPTAVETLCAASLQTYPNPTTGLVYVDNPAGAEVEVYTLSGVLVLRSKAAVVDLSQHAAGTYIIKVGNKVAKVVKQ